MDILNSLNSITTKAQKRRGRGIGSGVGGHTTGRGAKGDRVRGKTKQTFDGTKIKKSWIKRLPFLRGKHRVLSQKDVIAVNLSQLVAFAGKKGVIDIQVLSSNLRLRPTQKVKVLASGELTKPLNFVSAGILFSEKAKTKIIASGGKID